MYISKPFNHYCCSQGFILYFVFRVSKLLLFSGFQSLLLIPGFHHNCWFQGCIILAVFRVSWSIADYRVSLIFVVFRVSLIIAVSRVSFSTRMPISETLGTFSTSQSSWLGKLNFYIYLSLCLYGLYLFVPLSSVYIYLSLCLYQSIPLSLYLYLPFYPFIYQSIYHISIYISPFIHVSIFLSLHP